VANSPFQEPPINLTTPPIFRHAPAWPRPRTVLILCLIVPLLAVGLVGCGLVGPLVGAALPLAGVKLAFACIPEQTLVDTPSGPRAIERLEAGDWVTGYSGKPVQIQQKHCYLESPATVFLRIGFDNGAAVDLCGMHRLAGIRAGDLRVGQTVAGHRIRRIDARRGVTRSFDLLTSDQGYQIGGLPVNSMIAEMLAAAC